MNEPITPEQAKKLLQAIFAEEDTDTDDDYPKTIADKVSYAEYVLMHNPQHIGKALNRLSRLNRLLLVAGFFYEEICGSDERTRVCDNDCVVCALEWLRQAAKEEHHEAD